MNSTVFWSECRDSNSRPLEPHSSAIPNFATPGYLLASPDDFDILTHFAEKCKLFFHFFQKIFIASFMWKYPAISLNNTHQFQLFILFFCKRKSWNQMQKLLRQIQYISNNRDHSPRSLVITLPIFHR